MPKYLLYGKTILSDWTLPCPESPRAASPDVELREGSPEVFEKARAAALGIMPKDWFDHAILPDGSVYVRWVARYQFVVSPDGRVIFAQRPAGVPMESFLVYLLNGALSIALLKLGSDPLHATVVSCGGKTIGFLGRSGYGKSTLAASFVAAGFSVLTDDLLVLRQEKGRYLAYPGLPRIKLFPKSATAVWGKRPRGVAVSHVTKKLVIPLEMGQTVEQAVPLDALFVITSPESSARTKRVAIRPFTPLEAVLGLIKNTYVDWMEDPVRLKSQLLEYEKIARRVPVKSLRYPRRVRYLQAVREAILRDVDSSQNSTCESVAGSDSSGTPKS